MKILVIEDEKLLADSIKTLLEGKGFEVEVAYDGETGAEYAELGIYDLLILDVMMPNMDGLDATRAIRALDRADAKVVPIIAMTANAFDEDAKACFEAGMNAHLAKPFQMEKVVAVIAQFCRKA